MIWSIEYSMIYTKMKIIDRHSIAILLFKLMSIVMTLSSQEERNIYVQPLNPLFSMWNKLATNFVSFKNYLY